MQDSKYSDQTMYLLYSLIRVFTGLKPPLKKNTKIGFQYQLSLNAGQKVLLSTFIKLPFSIKTFSIKTFVLSILSGHLRRVLL